MKLKDKVIVITGASSGIGAATAKELTSKGAKVMLGARRVEQLQKLQSEIEEMGGTAEYLDTDVTNKEQAQALADAAIKSFGKIDVLCNSAGVMPLSFLRNLKLDEWDQMIDVNFRGVLYCVAAVLPHMREQQKGHIINVASIAGLKVGATGAVYCATKFAVRAFTEGLRLEEGKYLRTTIICPGAVDTNLTKTITDQEALKVANAYNAVSLQSESIANAAVYAIEQPDGVDVNEIVIRPVGEEY